MPGPLPKNLTLKQGKKNRSRALARVENKPARQAPPLPAHPTKGEKWHPLVTSWWAATWASELSANYIDADVPGLVRMAVLWDRFWKAPSAAVSAELRMMSAAYGLSPLDRRRLSWVTSKSHEAADAVERKRSASARVIDRDDPREAYDPREVLGRDEREVLESAP